ncbi:acetylornithine deacetylase [Komagataeibacter europaeus]|uniref:Acetylornithine deacetylase n=1 Tax=Komagataeibacter europaeus TaxID=33995 RepID=A0A0M0EFN4_KOMEU|nr:M20/M25/M40 family metallo-hydrolase [Komagataeibacter europaeus]KON64053.1 acetylornithine deacetylase [Komagataeibacter europaeus]
MTDTKETITVNTSREDLIASAVSLFDAGEYERRLRDLVAIQSTSQDDTHSDDVQRYLTEAMVPWLERMGFTCTIYPNPQAGFDPILMARRIEDPTLPSIITYGHGDTVRGMDEQWSEGLHPWELTRVGNRLYGRGSADNKGQHLCNLLALEHVLAAQDGRLGYNVKLVLEMSEERGSAGLDTFIRTHASELAADVFIASDGPRVAPDTPTVAGGTRGNFQFDLSVEARKGGVHSGHWGGITTDPALLVAQALCTICDSRGRIRIPEWLPVNGAPLAPAMRTMLRDCPTDNTGDAAQAEDDWGEPGLSTAERRYAWTSFIVRAMISGSPASPQNAVAPTASAACEIRYPPGLDVTTFLPALRRHLDAHGLQVVRIDNGIDRMPASATQSGSPWPTWVAASIARSTGARVQVIPSISGGMPGYAFADHLDVPLIWVPHGHNACKQHGPDEHILTTVARQGLLAFVGLWHDLKHVDFY